MKPFNLEEAKAGKPVVTRDGLKARILCFDARICLTRPLYALVTDKLDKSEYAVMYTEQGTRDYPAHTLYMKTEKKTGWIVVNPGYRKAMCSGNIYFSKQTAEEEAPAHTLIVPVEWEE